MPESCRWGADPTRHGARRAHCRRRLPPAACRRGGRWAKVLIRVRVLVLVRRGQDRGPWAAAPVRAAEVDALQSRAGRCSTGSRHCSAAGLAAGRAHTTVGESGAAVTAARIAAGVGLSDPSLRADGRVVITESECRSAGSPCRVVVNGDRNSGGTCVYLGRLALQHPPIVFRRNYPECVDRGLYVARQTLRGMER